MIITFKKLANSKSDKPKSPSPRTVAFDDEKTWKEVEGEPDLHYTSLSDIIPKENHLKPKDNWFKPIDRLIQTIVREIIFNWPKFK